MFQVFSESSHEIVLILVNTGQDVANIISTQEKKN